MTRPTTIAEVREAIQSQPGLMAAGGGTKPAMLAFDEGNRLDMRGVSGILDYQPGEYTFTALAGTPLSEIENTLADNGQYLPFDPPFITAGSTLGGMVASGLNGPGAFRFGGIRDFILGATFITPDGRLITTGGKVVKNAAGFDLAKFFVGSTGRWGTLAEITFKVFPKPPETTTLAIQCDDLSDCVHTMNELACGVSEFDALEIEPATRRVLARLRGTGLSKRPQETLATTEANSYWQTRADFSWAAGDALVKIPVTPSQIHLIAAEDLQIVFSIGGNVAWVSGSRDTCERMIATGFKYAPIRGLPCSDIPPTPLIERLTEAFTASD